MFHENGLLIRILFNSCSTYLSRIICLQKFLLKYHDDIQSASEEEADGSYVNNRINKTKSIEHLYEVEEICRNSETVNIEIFPYKINIKIAE